MPTASHREVLSGHPAWHAPPGEFAEEQVKSRLNRVDHLISEVPGMWMTAQSKNEKTLPSPVEGCACCATQSDGLGGSRFNRGMAYSARFPNESQPSGGPT